MFRRKLPEPEISALLPATVDVYRTVTESMRRRTALARVCAEQIKKNTNLEELVYGSTKQLPRSHVTILRDINTAEEYAPNIQDEVTDSTLDKF
jgi:hypothetical protein